MRFFSLEKLINLHDGYRRQFRIDDLELLLIQEQGERYLLESRCPHRGQRLLEARVNGGTIQCPLHGYRFSLQDGSVLTCSEEACRGLRMFTPIYEGNAIGVMLP